MLEDALALHEFSAGAALDIGPFQAETRLLPHWLSNAGLRLAAGGQVVAYTGDSGPSPLIAELARNADLLIAESSYAETVPEDSRRYLSSADDAGRQAAHADVGHLVLTHLLPGTDHAAAQAAARARYGGRLSIAVPDLVLDLGRTQT